MTNGKQQQAQRIGKDCGIVKRHCEVKVVK